MPCQVTCRVTTHSRIGDRQQYNGKNGKGTHKGAEHHDTTDYGNQLLATKDRGLVVFQALSFANAVFPGSQIIEMEGR